MDGILIYFIWKRRYGFPGSIIWARFIDDRYHRRVTELQDIDLRSLQNPSSMNEETNLDESFFFLNGHYDANEYQ